jgi:hypothetical protein
MKKFLLALATGLLTAGSAIADSCQVAPPTSVPAPGCSSMRPECVCDGYGQNCRYQFVCIPEAR